MTAVLLNLFGRLLSLSWLTGPIFAKELRVSSRRCRNYVLRSLYLFLLMGLLCMVWIMLIERGGSGLFRASRMAEVGKMVILCTVWFQFCVTQVVAVVMLSTSISDEIYNRTLGLLMTTPISSFQIVMGKLLSKLLQLILLLAISLPLLAIVRVFGGVPWGYVVSSLCVTFTTMIFFGSLSLLFSVFTRRAYIVIIMTVVVLFAILAVLPWLTGVLWFTATGKWPGRTLTEALFYHNPYGVMFSNTMTMLGRGGAPSFYWPLHCCIMLALSLLVLLVSVISVRKVALRQATGQLGASLRKRRPRKSTHRASIGRQDCPAPAMRVLGPPVIWKELKSPMLGRRKRLALLAVGLGLALVLGSYCLCAVQGVLDDAEIHIVYTIVYLGLGILFTIVLPSTCITSEKEARSWPLLLATTLDNKEILFGKFVGTLRRCFPIWLLLLGHTIAFSLAGSIHPVAIVHIGILVIWLMIFLSCSGVYFSSCFKRTTTAVIMNFVLALAIWLVIPVVLFLMSEITHDDDFAEDYVGTNPFVQAVVSIDATVGKSTPSGYWWPGSRGGRAFDATVWMLSCMAGYIFFGAVLAWRAQSRFRRNIF